MEHVQLRAATVEDLEAINDIYNYFVLTSTATYQIEPETMDGRKAWFDTHDALHPIIVAEADGRVLGWGSLSRFHPREAYARTVENSVYIHHEHHRRGIGAAVLTELIHLGEQLGHRTIIAGIDSEQARSIALHERCGFV